MTAAAIPEVHKPMRHFSFKAFKAMRFANVSPWSKPELAMPEVLAAPSLSLVDGGIPGAEASGPPLDDSRDTNDRNLRLTIPVADWDVLFNAIEWRLRLAVGNRAADAPVPEAGDTAGKVQVAVLECIAAMDALHAALTVERERVPRSDLVVKRI